MTAVKAPLLVAAAYAGGILLMIGHHEFYKQLDGKPVPTTPYTIMNKRLPGIAPQRFNLAVGNILATLSKAFLCFAVGAAYTQILFRHLKSQTSKVSVVDSAFAVTGNVFELLSLGVWKKYAGAAGLAILVWLLPIAAVVTPATLNVQSAAINSTDSMTVSNVDFTSLNFASIPETTAGMMSTYYYGGSQFMVSRLVAAIAGQGAILPLTPPNASPNASYTQTFLGPVLRCVDVEGQLLSQITKNIEQTAPTKENAKQEGFDVDSATSFGYIAWTPSGSDPRPFEFDNTSYTISPDTLGPVDVGPASVYVAVLPAMINRITSHGLVNASDVTANATVLQCTLYNSSYDATISWTNGVQNVKIAHGQSYGTVVPRNLLYAGAMGLGLTPGSSAANPWSYNVTLVQTFAYQAVMDALGQILVGTIGNSWESNGALQVEGTNIMNTILSDTKELDFLRRYMNGEGATAGWSSFQAYLSKTGASDAWPGVSVPDNRTANTLELRTAVEKLFENITISLMSSALLQADPSSPFAPAPVPVTLTSYETVYAYSAKTLWIAYGLAIALATIAIGIGLYSMIVERAYYSADFSTIMRMTQAARLSTTIADEDAAGRSPLPKHLANANITFRTDSREAAAKVQDQMYALEDSSGATARSRLL
ncbi:hypothetical protein B0A48_10229 [Cryoendolithus antarcticus]|uniref:Uncharacterized protein n=1 Tax=Cryoendolithus antarcticus TaxID=1507870 RepID=A0A1V8SWL5_9PEZI|nr:hypothetical protein B0A48_10229 [Cryoendolithus antarcticus]